MLIKVCGMRDPENIRAVGESDIDFMGFIFWEKSPRKAGTFSAPTNARVKKVGVFVDEEPQKIFQKIQDFHLDILQLHGSESPAYIHQLRHSLAPDIQIIKAISIRESADVQRWHEYEGLVDFFLFDTKCPCVGGSGKQFDWSVLRQYDGNIPFLLSGGIGPEDAERIKAFHHPMCIGIDLNSKFEDAPGLKNIDKLRNFLKAIRNE